MSAAAPSRSSSAYVTEQEGEFVEPEGETGEIMEAIQEDEAFEDEDGGLVGLQQEVEVLASELEAASQQKV